MKAYNSLLALALALLPCAVLSALPQILSVNVIVRDFSRFHSDFEANAKANLASTGILEPSLGTNAMPLFRPYTIRGPTSIANLDQSQGTFYRNDTKAHIANFGSIYFDEWYRDIPGVNIPISTSLNFALKDANLQTYAYPGGVNITRDFQSAVALMFYPVDNKGFSVESVVSATQGGLRNFWFTTELRTVFFYRGGETFTFLGDDDLWVYIDGKLTSCDLGGPHPRQKCDVSLDRLGILIGRKYELVVFHAERHTDESNFYVTTSIVPVNQAPVLIPASTRIIKEDGNLSLDLYAIDPDFDPLKFQIRQMPTNGQLTFNGNPVLINTWYSSNRIVYTPNSHFTGIDVLQYVASDGNLESTVGTMMLKVFSKSPVPFAPNFEFSCAFTDSECVGTLGARDEDTILSDLVYVISAQPDSVTVTISKTGQFTMKNPGAGKYQFRYKANDRYDNLALRDFGYSNEGTVTVTIASPGAYTSLNSGSVAAVAVGSIVAFASIAGIVGYLTYFRVQAKKNEAAWKHEVEQDLRQNPMFSDMFDASGAPLFTMPQFYDAPAANEMQYGGQLSTDELYNNGAVPGNNIFTESSPNLVPTGRSQTFGSQNMHGAMGFHRA